MSFRDDCEILEVFVIPQNQSMNTKTTTTAIFPQTIPTIKTRKKKIAQKQRSSKNRPNKTEEKWNNHDDVFVCIGVVVIFKCGIIAI